MKKRLITKMQTKILMLVSHEFEGLSQREAALRLDVSPATISRQLKAVKKVLPQYFPILTKLEFAAYDFYMNWPGWSVIDIGRYLGKTPNAVYSLLEGAYKKGMRRRKARGVVTSYDDLIEKYGVSWVDDHVKQRF